MKKYSFFFAWLCLLAWQCSANPTSDTLYLGAQKVVILLSAEAAASNIVEDRYEGYFEKVRPLELAIQMKKPLAEFPDRTTWLENYRAFLQTEVMEFSAKEKTQTRKVFQEAFELCQQLSPKLFPDTIRLIKITGNHYGPSVYYTRDKCILIPQNVYAPFNKEDFLDVMLHEIFHIYSRTNPTQKKALYQLIGFTPIHQLIFPPALDQRIFLNPDGIDMNWKVDLQLSSEQSVTAVPVILSNEADFKPGKPAFFAYLSFALFEVKENADGYHIIADDRGLSTLGPEAFPAYFQKIKDNTQYIIHPDEVLADNFLLAVRSQQEPKVLDDLSVEGKALLKAIEQQLIATD